MTISPSERALIDQAIAEGRVQQIPRGVSAFPVPVWRDGHLVLPEGGRKLVLRLYGSDGRAARAAKMRRNVLAEHDRGLRPSEIAAHLSVEEKLVRVLLRDAGRTPNVLDQAERSARIAEARRNRPEMVARRRRVLGLMSAGLSLAEISRQLGLHYELVKYDARVLRAGAAGPEAMRVA